MSEFTSCKDCKHYEREDDCYCGACKYQIRKDFFEPEKKKIELQDGKFDFSAYGKVSDIGHYDGYSPLDINVWKIRQTKEQAEIASQAMLRRNRLSALAELLGTGEKKFEEGTYYMVELRTADGCWGAYFKYYYSPCEVYMDKETAKALCHVLNQGLFEL